MWDIRAAFVVVSAFLLSMADAACYAGDKSPGVLPVRTVGPDLPAEFAALVEADWTRQEQRLGRTPHDPEAIRALLERTERLVEDVGRMERAPVLSRAAAVLASLRERCGSLPELDNTARLRLYRELRWLTRAVALANPLLGQRPIAFLKRRRFISQMLHEYLGYYYDYEDIAGGGVYVLDDPGRSLAVRDLIEDHLPRGNYTTLASSFDAGTLYFAFAPRAAAKPDYYSPGRRCFDVYAISAGGEDLRRLTDGPDDDFDPCPLPDGSVAFMSTRRGGFGRCHNPWEPLPAYTLHRMDADGGNVRTLSFHETNEWHPSVLADGRVVYSRWDYVDRSAAHFHGLWVSGPAGAKPMVLFGNYTQRINACFQPRSVPGSDRIVFIAGAHHADVGGSLVLLDPARLSLDPTTGQDSFDAIEVLTPEVCFPEAPGWPKSFFHSPWPLSEDYFLVSFSFDPLPGMGPKVKDDSETGLYLFDRFGNLELLYREPGVSCMYPIPLSPRPVPPVLGTQRDASLGDEGEFILTDVRTSHFPLPASRPIRELRVFQVLPKSETHVANQPRLGYANAESARLFLGTVPVEEDGSAYFRAPAGKPLYFHAVDDAGRAVQGMRSVTYLQPGERRGCVGCHERPGTAPPRHPPMALRRPPSTVRPGPDGSRPWSYPRLVQPVLDAHCVRCHDGTSGEGKHRPDLTAGPSEQFTLSYENLRPYAQWYEWGKAGIGGFVTRPGHMPADRSPLTKILDDTHHGSQVKLKENDRRRLYLWLDGNASFYGVYSRGEQLAQKKGKTVTPPTLQ